MAFKKAWGVSLINVINLRVVNLNVVEFFKDRKQPFFQYYIQKYIFFKHNKLSLFKHFEQLLKVEFTMNILLER